MDPDIEPAVHAARLEREREFHDHAFSTVGARSSTVQYYAVDSGKSAYHDIVTADAAGASVLVYGCGPFSLAPKLAERGADAVGIDISPVAVRRARRRAHKAGANVRYEVMDAHVLEFPDDSFDVVCGSGILHHLDLDLALAEVARVLRTTGEAVFYEPLGSNPVINLYRRLTPTMRTPDEHPLVDVDFARAAAHFGVVEREEHTFLALAGVVLNRLGPARRLVPKLQQMDRWLFRRVPLTRRLAWTVVVRLAEPRLDRREA